MPSIRRSVILSFAQNYTGLLITVPTVMILARFLTPAETGVFSVALAAVNLAHMLRDFGVSAYLVQEKNLTREKLRAAFSITLITAWAIALGMFLLAPVAGRFYNEPGVSNVLGVLAFMFVLIPFGAPAMSVLRRDLSYGALYVINTASAATRSAVSIIMALLGFSYMSLAWGALGGVVALTIAVSFYRFRDTWLMPGFGEWRHVVSFGSKKIVIDVLTQTSRSANSLVVGRMLGFAATGLFSRGEGLINLFQTKIMSSIQSVAFPAFASYHRSGKGVKSLYVRGVSYITAVTWPFYTFAAIMAYPVILAAFGSQWVAAVPILRILAIAAAIRSLNFSIGQLLMASGHINRFLRIVAIVQPLRIVLIVIAAFYSIAAVAAVQLVITMLSLWLNYRETGRAFDLHFGEVINASYRSGAVAFISNIIPMLVWALSVTGRITNPWIVLAIAGAGGALGWLVGVLVVRHPITAEFTLLKTQLSGLCYFARRENHG